jgi:hypothetical protein
LFEIKQTITPTLPVLNLLTLTFASWHQLEWQDTLVNNNISTLPNVFGLEFVLLYFDEDNTTSIVPSTMISDAEIIKGNEYPVKYINKTYTGRVIDIGRL